MKPREIDAPTLADCVAHHAVMNVMEPWFERRFIFDSYACRKGKGTHAASLRTREFMRRASGEWGTPYVLKADISRYFGSIRHDRLLSMLPNWCPTRTCCGCSGKLCATTATRTEGCRWAV